MRWFLSLLLLLSLESLSNPVFAPGTRDDYYLMDGMWHCRSGNEEVYGWAYAQTLEEATRYAYAACLTDGDSTTCSDVVCEQVVIIDIKELRERKVIELN